VKPCVDGRPVEVNPPDTTIVLLDGGGGGLEEAEPKMISSPPLPSLTSDRPEAMAVPSKMNVSLLPPLLTVATVLPPELVVLNAVPHRKWVSRSRRRRRTGDDGEIAESRTDHVGEFQLAGSEKVSETDRTPLVDCMSTVPPLMTVSKAVAFAAELSSPPLSTTRPCAVAPSGRGRPSRRGNGFVVNDRRGVCDQLYAETWSRGRRPRTSSKPPCAIVDPEVDASNLDRSGSADRIVAPTMVPPVEHIQCAAVVDGKPGGRDAAGYDRFQHRRRQKAESRPEPPSLTSWQRGGNVVVPAKMNVSVTRLPLATVGR